MKAELEHTSTRETLSATRKLVLAHLHLPELYAVPDVTRLVEAAMQRGGDKNRGPRQVQDDDPTSGQPHR